MMKKVNSIMMRFRYWMTPKRDCKCCCVNCKYFRECAREWMG